VPVGVNQRKRAKF